MQQTIDSLLNTFGDCSDCQCCERHQRKKPYRLPIHPNQLQICLEGGSSYINETHHNYHMNDSCTCSCRHEMRWICRFLANRPEWTEIYASPQSPRSVCDYRIIDNNPNAYEDFIINYGQTIQNDSDGGVSGDENYLPEFNTI